MGGRHHILSTATVVLYRRFCGEQLLQVPTVSETSSQTTQLWALVDMISCQLMLVWGWCALNQKAICWVSFVCQFCDWWWNDAVVLLRRDWLYLVGFVWWLWVNKVIIYSFRKCLALWWNELHLECESLYVLPCPVRSKWHDHLLALSVREIRSNNVVFIRSHIFYECSLGSIMNYESIFSQLHGRFPVLSFAGLILSQGVEFSLVMVSATFWWMFTRYYFELSIFWKFHLIWLIALCGWLIVTSQICCHVVTSQNWSAHFDANLLPMWSQLFGNFFTAIYRSYHSGCSFHSDALVKSDFR